MFSKIQNPETGNWVNVNGVVGRKVLRNYVRQMGGAGTREDMPNVTSTTASKKDGEVESFAEWVTELKHLYEKGDTRIPPTPGPCNSESALREIITENKLNNNINEEDIFHIINHCSSINCNILITSNMNLNEYTFQLKDLSSRLKTFININIDLPDDELLVNLMTKLFHDKQIIVKNPEIFHYIIKRVDRSYEKIFHLIDKIDNLLMKKNKQLTIPIIKELI